MNFIYHWLWQDVWVPVWPNWVAGIVVAIIAWFWKIEPHFKKIHEHNARVRKHLGIKE